MPGGYMGQRGVGTHPHRNEGNRRFGSGLSHNIPKLTEYGGARLGIHYQQAEAGFVPSAGPCREGARPALYGEVLSKGHFGIEGVKP